MFEWRVFGYRWTPHAIRRGLGDGIPGEPHLTDDGIVLVGASGLKVAQVIVIGIAVAGVTWLLALRRRGLQAAAPVAGAA